MRFFIEVSPEMQGQVMLLGEDFQAVWTRIVFPFETLMEADLMRDKLAFTVVGLRALITHVGSGGTFVQARPRR